MRKYQDRKNTQKKAYYTDRFRVANVMSKEEVSTDEIFNENLENFKSKLQVNEAYIQRGQLVIWVDFKDIFKALQTIKDIGYEVLTEMSAIDFIAQKNGFEIFYQMLSISKVKRARIKCFLPKNEQIQSISSLYSSANWSERECYDMFGIIFLNHPNLKRILMPDDWSGYPLLKTYPLKGDEAAQWYEVDKIFGKEYRDMIGAEQRDSAFIDENDTQNFSRLNHQVPFDSNPSREKTFIDYQEANGVFIVKKLKKEDAKIIKLQERK